MSKNKFIKKLLIAGLCAVTATAMIGATACKPDNKEPEEPAEHVHNWATGDDWSKDENGHWHRCKNAGHTDEYDKTAHTDDNHDDKCDVCGWTMTSGGGQEEGPGGEEGPTANATEKVKIDISNISSLTANEEIVAGSGIYATSAMAMEAKDRTILYNGETITTTKWFKTGGTITKTEKSLKFVIENNNTTIIVYASSATNGTERFLTIKGESEDGELVDVDGQEVQSVGKGNNLMGTAIFEVNKGTYYVGSSSSGVNIAYIAVWQGGKLNETVVDTKEAKPASCEDPGNIAYTKTSFGRFKNSAGETVPEHELYTPATGHDWELDDKENWTLPGKDGDTYTEGSLTLLCNNDHNDDKLVTLPALNSGKYVIATKQQDDTLDEGMARYGYAIPGSEDSDGKKITAVFVAVEVEQTNYSYNTLYSNILNGTIGIGQANKTSLADGISLYGKTNESTEITEWSDDNYNLTASGDVLTLLDRNVSKSSFAYLVFDEAITSGVYKISGTINLTNYKVDKDSEGNATITNTNQTASKWSPIQLIAEGLETDPDTFASLRADNDKKLGVVASSTGNSVQGAAYAYAVATDYDFEFLIDIDHKEVTLKITTADTKTEVYKDTVTVTATQWKGIRLQTGDSAARIITLKNLVIAERVENTGTEN